MPLDSSLRDVTTLTYVVYSASTYLEHVEKCVVRFSSEVFQSYGDQLTLFKVKEVVFTVMTGDMLERLQEWRPLQERLRKHFLYSVTEPLVLNTLTPSWRRKPGIDLML